MAAGSGQRAGLAREALIPLPHLACEIPGWNNPVGRGLAMLGCLPLLPAAGVLQPGKLLGEAKVQDLGCMSEQGGF